MTQKVIKDVWVFISSLFYRMVVELKDINDANTLNDGISPMNYKSFRFNVSLCRRDFGIMIGKKKKRRPQ